MSHETIALLIAIGSLIVAAMVAVHTYSADKRRERKEPVDDVKTQLEKFTKDLNEIFQRLAKAEVRLDISFTWIEKAAVSILHHPTTPDLDRLLEKYIDPNERMTGEEISDLAMRLRAIVDHDEDGVMKLAASHLLAAMVQRGYLPVNYR